MEPQFQAFERLKQLLSDEEAKLLAAVPRRRRRVALLEVTRAIDSLSGLQRSRDGHEARALWHSYYIHGWPRALRLLLDDETAGLGDPYFLSTSASHQMSLSFLRTCSQIATCEQAINLCDHGLFSLEDWTEGRFVFRRAEVRVGWEAEERGDQDWLRWQLSLENVPFYNALREHDKPMRKALRRNVQRVEDFMAYQSTPILDEYFDAEGSLYSRTCFGQDLFPDATMFGGRPFSLFRSTVRTLIGWALRHEAFCGVLLKQYPELCVRNVFTQCSGIDSLADGLSAKLGVTLEDARLALEMVTASRGNKSIMIESGPSPMLVEIGKDRVIKSYAGATTQPYYFMLRALKARFLDDWNAATDAREKVFRDEIYSVLFRFRLNCIRKPIDVRTPKGNTDIDAVVLDEGAGSLGVFQLKWQEPFGYSLKERSSRKQNFEKANKWVDRVSSWLASRSLAEAGADLGLDSDTAKRVRHCHIIVVSREHSHFSGPNELDERAAWGNWFQMRRLFETFGAGKESPVDFLARSFRQRSERGPSPRSSSGSGSEFRIAGSLIQIGGA
jgi:hypothetical protein